MEEGFVTHARPTFSKLGTSILKFQILWIKIHMCGMRGFELASLATLHLWVHCFHTEPRHPDVLMKSSQSKIAVAFSLYRICLILSCKIRSLLMAAGVLTLEEL